MAKVSEALGYSELRQHQMTVVYHFLGGKDVFVSLPTSSGKSLCYCLLPKAFYSNIFPAKIRLACEARCAHLDDVYVSEAARACTAPFTAYL